MRLSALFADFYALTMAQAYDAEHMGASAVFELAFRRMPSERNYIVAAGFNDVIEFLTDLRFTATDIDYLRGHHDFSARFLERLESMSFTGDLYAVPEGSLVFPNEPLLQVVAPILEAQLVETFVVNQIQLQSLMATKAARIVQAAKGRVVFDFGSRRAHGIDAAIKVARSTYLGGGAGTSNVLAGKMYGIPVFGTMAHSYIEAHDDEAAAFEEFAAIYPKTTLLVDTYDTIRGVGKVIELSKKLGRRFQVEGVRLDSGDLVELAVKTRKMLDDAGLPGIKIFASNGLDEHRIQKLIGAGAPIDGFGVGTKLAVSEDVPDLDIVYKLVEYAGKGRLKLSTDKVLHPGRKQVFRQVENGRMQRDVIGRFAEQLPGEPMLLPLIERGRPVMRIDLEESRRYAQRELKRLPEELRALSPGVRPYPVTFSERLEADFKEATAALTHE